MKKELIATFIFVSLSFACLAQEGRKVPFLPYVQMNGAGGATVDSSVPFQQTGVSTTQSRQKVSTVFFAKNSSVVRKEDVGTISSVARRVRDRNGLVRLVAYRSPEMDPAVVGERLKNVQAGLQDLGVKNVVATTEYREKPVISADRVDIYEL